MEAAVRGAASLMWSLRRVVTIALAFCTASGMRRSMALISAAGRVPELGQGAAGGRPCVSSAAAISVLRMPSGVVRSTVSQAVLRAFPCADDRTAWKRKSLLLAGIGVVMSGAWLRSTAWMARSSISSMRGCCSHIRWMSGHGLVSFLRAFARDLRMLSLMVAVVTDARRWFQSLGLASVGRVAFSAEMSASGTVMSRISPSSS